MKNKVLSFFSILVVTIIVLYFSLKDDYTTIINTILNINKIWLLIAFLLLFIYYFLRSFTIYSFTKKFNKDYKLIDGIILTLKTNFFHAITPFSTGGQPYEIYDLNKSNIKISDAANISIENFIVYQIALVFLGVISIIFNSIFKILDSNFLKHFLTLGFIINLLVIVFLFWITLSKKTDNNIINILIKFLEKIKIIKDSDKLKDKFNNYLIEFDKGSRILLKDKKNFIFLILIQIISLISLYLIPLVLSYGIRNKSIGIFECIMTMSYVMLIGSFVPIPGGTGGLEYGFVSFFKNFIPGSEVNAIMLLWRFITYYFGMILGAIFLNFKKEVKK